MPAISGITVTTSKSIEGGASKQSDSGEGVSIDGDCGLCHYSALKILGQDTLCLPRCPVPSAPESTPAFFAPTSPRPRTAQLARCALIRRSDL
jgi:hypothetical protein